MTSSEIPHQTESCAARDFFSFSSAKRRRRLGRGGAQGSGGEALKANRFHRKKGTCIPVPIVRSLPTEKPGPGRVVFFLTPFPRLLITPSMLSAAIFPLPVKYETGAYDESL